MCATYISTHSFDSPSRLTEITVTTIPTNQDQAMEVFETVGACEDNDSPQSNPEPESEQPIIHWFVLDASRIANLSVPPSRFEKTRRHRPMKHAYGQCRQSSLKISACQQYKVVSNAGFSKQMPVALSHRNDIQNCIVLNNVIFSCCSIFPDTSLDQSLTQANLHMQQLHYTRYAGSFRGITKYNVQTWLSPI